MKRQEFGWIIVFGDGTILKSGNTFTTPKGAHGELYNELQIHKDSKNPRGFVVVCGEWS